MAANATSTQRRRSPNAPSSLSEREQREQLLLSLQEEVQLPRLQAHSYRNPVIGWRLTC